ncbi:MAG TPA: FixH family protein [Candidatus Salinicoccus stercoripullorum]|uniref:FixH family protein n=1 Tax=Candidatus Salinicoccus stercoripullorum TaxID=2838756 RepID=A0A9D1QHC2_9STAP|nr:FixH family protein [Candidatus Salinicoccus stercoripullorum]
MKSKIWMTAMLTFVMLLGACGNDVDSENGEHGSHEEADEEVRSLEVDLEVPETAEAGEKESFTAYVHSNGEDVTDADEVRFEVLDADGGSLDMIEAEHSENGLYSIEYTFEEAGDYSVISHVDAYQLHTMPEKQITVE